MGGDCGRALDRLQEYLDGELTDELLGEIAVHLAACYPCGDRAEFERHLRAVVRMRCVDAAPAGLIDRVRERVRIAGTDA